MFRGLFRTSGDSTLSFMRLVLGVLFFVHGAQKALGWWGGYGWNATAHTFEQTMHIPAVLAAAAILAEFVGGIFLIFGFLTRLAAAGIAVNMLVAIWLVHFRNGLFMNWTGSQQGEGFEYHLLAIAIAITLVVRGAGALSVDRAISGSMPGGRPPIRMPRAA